MENCVFCKIIAGQIAAVKIAEDENFFIFLDARPMTPGHTLVIPKKHTEYILDLAADEYARLMEKVRDVAAHMQQKLQPLKVGMAVEGFGVPHVHVHVIPLNGPGELNPDRAMSIPAEKLEEMAQKLR